MTPPRPDEEWTPTREEWTTLLQTVTEARDHARDANRRHSEVYMPAIQQVWVNKSNLDEARGAIKLLSILVVILSILSLGMAIHEYGASVLAVPIAHYLLLHAPWWDAL